MNNLDGAERIQMHVQYKGPDHWRPDQRMKATIDENICSPSGCSYACTLPMYDVKMN